MRQFNMQISTQTVTKTRRKKMLQQMQTTFSEN